MKRLLAMLIAATAGLAAQAPANVPGLEWARIPAGTYQRGCSPSDMRCDADESPRHAVTISRAFDLMTTEATVGMWRAVNKGVDEQPAWSTSPAHPVVIVDWEEASQFCAAVGGRLPTEAEWERAARGGREAAIFPWGDQAPDDRDGAAHGAAFESDSARPVKSFGANGYGLYDMAGNVWEWVSDAYRAYPAEAVTDPHRTEIVQMLRLVRGGAYGDDQGNLRVSNRNPNRAGNVNVNVGFRCARDAN